jgi:hypothetical protein
MGSLNIVNEMLDGKWDGVSPHDAEQKERVINFLNEWLFHVDDFFGESVDSSEDVTGVRCVWVFPNQWVFTMPHDAPAFFAHLEDEIKSDDPMFDIVMGDVLDPAQWTYEAAVNGWLRKHFLAYEDEPSEIITILARLEALWGKPYVVYPMLNLVERVTDDEKYYTDEINNEEESGDVYNLVGVKKAVMRMFKALHSGEVKKYLPWDLKLAYPYDYVPRYSAAGRVYALSNELDDTGEWFISLDEHCGSCLSGMRSSHYESNPGKVFHEFVTWGQSARYEWGADGATNVKVYVTEESLDALKPFLIKHGFYNTVDDIDEQYGSSQHGEIVLKIGEHIPF